MATPGRWEGSFLRSSHIAFFLCKKVGIERRRKKGKRKGKEKKRKERKEKLERAKREKGFTWIENMKLVHRILVRKIPSKEIELPLVVRGSEVAAGRGSFRGGRKFHYFPRKFHFGNKPGIRKEGREEEAKGRKEGKEGKGGKEEEREEENVRFRQAQKGKG